MNGNSRIAVVSMLGALLLTGCLVRSTEPWLADASKVTSPSLAGTWEDSGAKATFFFTLQGSNYAIRVVQEGKGASFFSASLHKVGDQLLLVAGPTEMKTLDAFVLAPAHLLLKANLADGVLALHPLNLDAVPDRLRASALAPSLSGSREKGFLLTAPTAALEEFIRAQIGTPDLFATEPAFRLKKLSSADGAPATPAPR